MFWSPSFVESEDPLFVVITEEFEADPVGSSPSSRVFEVMGARLTMRLLIVL